jgi:hypothetical protein
MHASAQLPVVFMVKCQCEQLGNPWITDSIFMIQQTMDERKVIYLKPTSEKVEHENFYLGKGKQCSAAICLVHTPPPQR